MNQRQSEQCLKHRLENCRKSFYPLSENTKVRIKQALKDKSVSKKAVCKVYSMTYQQLKMALN